MNTSEIAIVISASSAGIALFSLGWNVYRDIVLKPKVKVRLQISEIYTVGEPPGNERPTYIDITATNFGPRKIILQSLYSKYRRLLRKKRWGFICNDITNPLSAKFPCTIDVGEKATFLLPFDKKCFLSRKVPFSHFGIGDSFGRKHWAPKKDIKRAIKDYQKEFKQTSDRDDGETNNGNKKNI